MQRTNLETRLEATEFLSRVYRFKSILSLFLFCFIVPLGLVTISGVAYAGTTKAMVIGATNWKYSVIDGTQGVARIAHKQDSIGQTFQSSGTGYINELEFGSNGGSFVLTIYEGHNNEGKLIHEQNLVAKNLKTIVKLNKNVPVKASKTYTFFLLSLMDGRGIQTSLSHYYAYGHRVSIVNKLSYGRLKNVFASEAQKTDLMFTIRGKIDPTTVARLTPEARTKRIVSPAKKRTCQACLYADANFKGKKLCSGPAQVPSLKSARLLNKVSSIKFIGNACRTARLEIFEDPKYKSYMRVVTKNISSLKNLKMRKGGKKTFNNDMASFKFTFK